MLGEYERSTQNLLLPTGISSTTTQMIHQSSSQSSRLKALISFYQATMMLLYLINYSVTDNHMEVKVRAGLTLALMLSNLTMLSLDKLLSLSDPLLTHL